MTHKMVSVEPQDLRIEYWSSKPQSSWLTYPPRGVRITHLPTGLVVTEESHRSQHGNKEQAVERLKSMLAAISDLLSEQGDDSRCICINGEWRGKLCGLCGGTGKIAQPYVPPAAADKIAEQQQIISNLKEDLQDLRTQVNYRCADVQRLTTQRDELLEELKRTAYIRKQQGSGFPTPETPILYKNIYTGKLLTVTGLTQDGYLIGHFHDEEESIYHPATYDEVLFTSDQD